MSGATGSGQAVSVTRSNVVAKAEAMSIGAQFG
jgi:hypothetical protein